MLCGYWLGPLGCTFSHLLVKNLPRLHLANTQSGQGVYFHGLLLSSSYLLLSSHLFQVSPPLLLQYFNPPPHFTYYSTSKPGGKRKLFCWIHQLDQKPVQSKSARGILSRNQWQYKSFCVDRAPEFKTINVLVIEILLLVVEMTLFHTCTYVNVSNAYI